MAIVQNFWRSRQIRKRYRIEIAFYRLFNVKRGLRFSGVTSRKSRIQAAPFVCASRANIFSMRRNVSIGRKRNNWRCAKRHDAQHKVIQFHAGSLSW